MEIKKKNSVAGQSTIEFIMTFSASIGFIFLFLKMAMNFTDGYMVHHATFLSARAYLVSDENRNDLGEGDARAMVKARDVFTRYLPPGLVSGIDQSALKENNPEPGKTKFHAFVGLWAAYSSKFSLGFIGGKESINFISEAFLGREPTRSETREQTCVAIKSLNLNSCDVHVTLEDNGG
ncbi:MAG: hypothetical protein K2Q18_16490 [Bdellovibrionales bacterium]|nr:hypothetical protein [Bdellovibrionales bacterium]